MQAWRIREPIMWLCELITGNRKLYGMNMIGGVRRDITAEQYPKIIEVVGKIEAQLKELIDAIAGDTTLHLRLRNVGVLSRETAQRLCVVGPTARGSGLAIDSRVDHPYAAYPQVPPKIITMPEGDIWARTLVRLQETLESITVVRRALEQLPPGELMAEVKEIPPWREGIAYVEAPRGEDCHYVLTGPDNRPHRWRVRAPSYTNLQAVPTMLKGNFIADAPIIIGSLDPCFSCTERLEVVDVKTEKIKVYGQAELREISKKR
jgi:formate hydrogenlyase subunit 5